jgi:glycerol uptake facilitator-like aquaporin
LRHAKLDVDSNFRLLRDGRIVRTAVHAVLAECLGSAALLAIVVGSGIMGENLAQGNMAMALLANSLATGAGLYVLITLLGPISGAHFNPVVTFVMWCRGERTTAELFAYVAAQIVGAIAGVWLAHLMFDLPVLQAGIKARTGAGQWISEAIATAGLLATILLGLRAKAAAIPALVGSYIMAAYWFTASTSFANPAVTFARSLTGTFAGIRLADVPGFVLAEMVGMFVVLGAWRLLRNPQPAQA